MSVNWLWKSKMGTLYVTQKLNGATKQPLAVNIYGANCLGALIYEYKDKGTRKNMYYFWGYWNDFAHLKSILGLSDKFKENLYRDPILYVCRVKLNVHYKDMLKVADLFAKAGIKVELYCEDPLSKSHYEVRNINTNKMLTWDYSKKVCQNYLNECSNQHTLKIVRVKGGNN